MKYKFPFQFLCFRHFIKYGSNLPKPKILENWKNKSWWWRCWINLYVLLRKSANDRMITPYNNTSKWKWIWRIKYNGSRTNYIIRPMKLGPFVTYNIKMSYNSRRFFFNWKQLKSQNEINGVENWRKSHDSHFIKNIFWCLVYARVHAIAREKLLSIQRTSAHSTHSLAMAVIVSGKFFVNKSCMKNRATGSIYVCMVCMLFLPFTRSLCQPHF